jgi:hypothetical protein
VAVGVALVVGEGVFVEVTEGVVVTGTGVSPPQAGTKTTKSTIIKSVYFMKSPGAETPWLAAG